MRSFLFFVAHPQLKVLPRSYSMCADVKYQGVAHIRTTSINESLKLTLIFDKLVINALIKGRFVPQSIGTIEPVYKEIL